MNGQRLVPADLVLQEVHPAVDLAMHEGRVHLVVDVDRLLLDGISRFFYEHGHHRVEWRDVHLPEKHPQTAGVEEHVVVVAEHHVVRSRRVQRSVTSRRHPTMRDVDLLD